MSFFSSLFGSRNPLNDVTKASKQERWADVLSFSSALDDNSLSATDQVYLRGLVDTASENLSRINFEEGLASLRSNDFRRGMEHLDLARQLVRSCELRGLIDTEFARIGVNNNLTGEVQSRDGALFKKSCASSCCGTSDNNSEPVTGEVHSFDEETRFELVLTAYPLDLRPRYLEVSTLMRQAILFAHEERAEEALSLFLQVPKNEQSDLFFYELGSLFARINQYSDAVKALQQAIGLNPGLFLAALILVDLHIANKNFSAAENLLVQMLQVKCMPDYCYARLSVISQAKGESEKAFEQATAALALGNNEPELIVFVARILESNGRLDEAEAALSSIQVGGGCSGGANVELADFWLRHKKNLQKSLEMFKNAAKGDPTNPLWGYNIARVYLALGWKREAKQILESFVKAESIDGALRENAIQLLKNMS